jgi:hypothetical protein
VSDFAEFIEPVAKLLLGEPNRAVSTKDEWRYGTRGSLVVKVAGPNKGTFVDHEAGGGGGVLDLVARHQGGDRKAAAEWLRREFPDFAGQPEPIGSHRIVATYPYRDEAGELLFEVVRREPKDFRQRRPDGAGGWTWSIKGVRMVPYHLPDLIEALAQDRTIYIVEGEKDVDRLRRDGIAATCNPGGAGKWRDDLAPIFDGADVVILPDNDEAGREHAAKVARSLAKVAARIRVVELPGLPRKGDVSDWYAAGGTVEALQALAEAAADWRPAVATHFPFILYGDEDRGPPLSWLVKGVLVNGGLSAIFGQPGTSKTFAGVDLGLSVAHGREWFGRRVQVGGVVYVSGEGGAGMKLRIKAWRAEKVGDERAPFAMVPSSVNLFDDDLGAEKLIDDLKLIGPQLGVPLRLIVLDTLSRMIGSGDEDRARDINVFVQKAEKIQRETGAHVLVVHHAGKDKDRGMRGSNALLGAVDAAIEITRQDSGLCEAKVVKVKDGGDVEPFRYSLRQSVLGQDEDGDDITSCVIEPSTDASPGERKAGPRLSDTEKIALDALRDALVDEGKPSPGGAVPLSARVVAIEAWRRRAYNRRISEADTEEARKKAFQRVRERLQARHLIGISGDLAWLAE